MACDERKTPVVGWSVEPIKTAIRMGGTYMKRRRETGIHRATVHQQVTVCTCIQFAKVCWKIVNTAY